MASLFLSSKPIFNDQIITPDQAKLEISYDFKEAKHKHTILLLNTTTDFVQWMKDGEADVFPYIAPITPGRYLFLIFDSTNLNPTVNSRENFTKMHRSKEFGILIGKTAFIVEGNIKTGFDTLPVELNRLIALNVPLNEIYKYCDITPTLNKQICKSRAFDELLARTRLTNDSEIIKKIDTNEIIDTIQTSERLFNGPHWWDMSNNKDDIFKYLIKYNVLRDNALKTLDTIEKGKLLLEVARRNLNTLLAPIYYSIPAGRGGLYGTRYDSIFNLIKNDPTITKESLDQIVLNSVSFLKTDNRDRYLEIVKERFPHLLAQVQQIANTTADPRQIRIRLEPVQGLPQEVLNEDDVRDEFERYGEVITINLLEPNRYMIQFRDFRDAQDARNDPIGNEWRGYTIVIEN
jgi:hypothetical protein